MKIDKIIEKMILAEVHTFLTSENNFILKSTFLHNVLQRKNRKEKENGFQNYTFSKPNLRYSL